MKKIIFMLLMLVLSCNVLFAEQTSSHGKPIPGTDVPEEYDNLAMDENDDSMSQFNRAIIDEKVQSGRYQ